MWTLIVTLLSTVGIQHPITLTGPPQYETMEACIKAGNETVNWLTQDFMRVTYVCEYKEN